MESSSRQGRSEFPWAQYEQLSDWRYCTVDWKTKLDIPQFLASCPWKNCHVSRVKGKRCPLRCFDCQIGTMRPIVARAMFERAREERERAAEEARALTQRAEEESPGLFTLDKLWLPHAPGVALIRGDLLVDVANFFRQCDITVREHNEPTTNRSLQGKGWDLISVSGDPKFRFFFRPTMQVRVQIDKFYPPPDEVDFEHYGEGVLCGLRRAHSNAIWMLLNYLGGTGENWGGNLPVDRECSYFCYSPEGFGRRWRNGGTPFRMVRVLTEPVTDCYEIMLRLGLERGRKRAKHFCDHFKETVKERKIVPWLHANLRRDSLDNVPAESGGDGEYEIRGLTDTSEGSDVTNQSDDSGSEDLSGLPVTPAEEAAFERRLAEARVARERELAAEAAEKERLAEQADAEKKAAEDQAPRVNTVQEAVAKRKERQARQAARKAAEAQAARERRLAEAAEKDKESRSEVGEIAAPGERQDPEGNESNTESDGTIDSGEEEDTADEPRRDMMRLAPEHLRRGGKE